MFGTYVRRAPRIEHTFYEQAFRTYVRRTGVREAAGEKARPAARVQLVYIYTRERARVWEIDVDTKAVVERVDGEAVVYRVVAQVQVYGEPELVSGEFFADFSAWRPAPAIRVVQKCLDAGDWTQSGNCIVVGRRTLARPLWFRGDVRWRETEKKVFYTAPERARVDAKTEYLARVAQVKRDRAKHDKLQGYSQEGLPVPSRELNTNRHPKTAELREIARIRNEDLQRWRRNNPDRPDDIFDDDDPYFLPARGKQPEHKPGEIFFV